MTPETKRLDLLLINPGSRSQVYGRLGSSLAGIEPPIFAGLVAAVVRRQGYSVRILDAEAENWSPEYTAEKVAEENPLLVDIEVLGSNPSASSTPKMTAAGELARAIKQKVPQAKTLFSGLHPSSLPERTLVEETADFVCQGEGFETIPLILEALKAGRGIDESHIPGLWYTEDKRVKSGPMAPLANPDDLPMTAWDLLPMGKYRAHNWHCFDDIEHRQPYGVIYTSLGCPFNCSYCNIHALYDGKPGIRFRSPEKVVEEIDFLVKQYSVRNIKFIDELFALKEDRVLRLCDLIIERGYDLNIWAYARVDTVSEKMLGRMKQAGINWLAYGFESADAQVRRGVAKKFEQDTVARAVEITRAAGIYIIGNFIFGLPDDTLDTMQETLEMAKEFNFEYANFYVAMAYPGSQLYNEALSQGIPLPAEWYGYSQYAEETLPLPTKHLSAAEVLRFRDAAFKEYFSNPAYLRMIKEKFGQNVVEHIERMLKHEIRRKFV
ncbi:MAG: B12-binding domain-containing radical SAM protein [Chloroflexi bacterium]|nr:B12-binding domain-containing radical SAM protein [Chloroflexota bacterium]